jgi:hypothetical protein
LFGKSLGNNFGICTLPEHDGSAELGTGILVIKEIFPIITFFLTKIRKKIV